MNLIKFSKSFSWLMIAPVILTGAFFFSHSAIATTPSPMTLPAPPKQLSCNVNSGVRLGVVHRDGVPLAVTAEANSGTHECILYSTTKPNITGDTTQFEWTQSDTSTLYRATITKQSRGFNLELQQPGEAKPQCGTIALPTKVTLVAGPGCIEKIDRAASFNDTWQIFSRAVKDNDTAALMAVADKTIELAENDEFIKQPKTFLQNSTSCIARLRFGDKTIKDLVANTSQAIPGTGDFKYVKNEVQIGNALVFLFTNQRWVLKTIGASRAAMKCQ
jgi:hypothetical protein